MTFVCIVKWKEMDHFNTILVTLFHSENIISNTCLRATSNPKTIPLRAMQFYNFKVLLSHKTFKGYPHQGPELQMRRMSSCYIIPK